MTELLRAVGRLALFGGLALAALLLILWIVGEIGPTP